MFPLKWFSDVKHAILIKPLNTKSLIKVGMYKKMSLKRNGTTSFCKFNVHVAVASFQVE